MSRPSSVVSRQSAGGLHRTLPNIASAAAYPRPTQVACHSAAGSGAALQAACAVAVLTCAAAFAWWCCLALCLCAGLGVAAGTEEVVVVVEVVAAGAAVWVVDVEEAAPQALTSSVSTTAARGMRRCLIDVSCP